MSLKNNSFSISPFIKEIPLDNNYILLFNLLNCSIVRIRKDVWEAIKHGNNHDEYTNIIRELENREFIIKGNVTKEDLAKYIEYRFYRSMFLNSTLTLWISVTSKCNLVCTYCYLSSKPGLSMNLENAHKVVLFADKQCDQLRGVISSIHVLYYGGEPLLNYKVVKYLHNEILKISKKHDLTLNETILTNGTLLSRKIIEELNSWENNVAIQVTLDGTQEWHDKRRPFMNKRGSFSVIYNNFINLIDQYNNGDIALRSNVDEHNIMSVEELLSKLRSDVGSRVSKVNVNFSWIYPSQDKILNMPSTCSIIDANKAKMLLKLYKHALNLGFKITITSLLQGPCLASCAHGYAIDESLRVYKCGGFLYSDKYFAYIDDKGDLQLISFDRYLRNYIGILFKRKCYLRCEFGPLCYGGCKAFNSCPYELLKIFTEEFPKLILLRKQREKEKPLGKQ